MNNYKLKLEYNGEHFSGSQKQNSNNLRTVQEELEKALTILCKEELNTTFAGRTDAGVHAIGQVVNFHTTTALADIDTNPGKFLLSLNSQLPEDIVATKITKVDEGFNARFDAKSREYLYKIFVRRQRPVLRIDSLSWIKEELDFDVMARHAASLVGKRDWSAYAKIDDNQDNAECEIFESELIQESKICYKYRIKGNRFLRHMVRNIVGELIWLGKGRDIEEAGKAPMAEACGLTLVSVNY